MIYLASPWSHPDPAVREQRYRDALRATAALMNAGHLVYSPIVYSHPLHAAGVGTSGAWDEWARLDTWFVERCSFLWVLTLPGWEASRGIRAEVRLASDLNKPMRHVTLEECLNGGPDARP